MSLLIPIALAALAVACRRRGRQGWRESTLQAALLLGAAIVLSTEALSANHWIGATSVTVLWLVLATGAVVAAFVARSRSLTTERPSARDSTLGFPTRVIALASAAILALTLLVAVVAPPDYTDAMTYHMARVAHWIQEHSVAYYPTGIVRQNLMMPFAEYVILHLQLLSGGDRWANLVQWSAFALSGMTVSLVLDDLRMSPRVQWTGAFLTYAVPMAILQATGAQNDLVVGLWLLAFLLFLRRMLHQTSLKSAAFCGLALGLALATKGTAYLYASAMGGVLLFAWVAVSPIREWRRVLTGLVAVLVIGASLNLGPWLRTQSAYGMPLCCGDDYFIPRARPAVLVTNVLRNTALHLGIPGFADDVARAVRKVAPAWVNDPKTTMGRFGVAFSLDEGRAGNVLHLLSAIGVAIVLVVSPRSRRGPTAIWLAVAVAGFLSLAVPLVWQPWGSRLQTPAFLASAIPIAIVLGNARFRVAGPVLAAFFASSMLYALHNEPRPLIPVNTPSILVRPRIPQYFALHRSWEEPSRRTAAFLRASGEPEVGLVFQEVDYEYPLWVLVKDDFADEPRFRHVGPRAERVIEWALPPPALIVTTQEGERLIVDGTEYVRVREERPLSVLRRSEPTSPRAQ